MSYRSTLERLFAVLSLLCIFSPLAGQESVCDSVAGQRATLSSSLLTTIVSGGGYALFVRDELDEALRATRHQLWTPEARNHYDDYLQFAGFGLSWGMHCGGAVGRSARTIEMAAAQAMGIAGTFVVVQYIKDTARRLRPDGSTANSFPSGHTATAFLGATLFDLEYGERYPLLAHSQYLLAGLVGVGRMYNNRHWYSDVLTGAVVGASMAQVGYMLSDLIFHPGRVSLGRDECSVRDGFYLSLQTMYYLRGQSPRGCVGVGLGYEYGAWELSLQGQLLSNSMRAPQMALLVQGGYRLFEGDWFSLQGRLGLGTIYGVGESVLPLRGLVGVSCGVAHRWLRDLRLGLEMGPWTREGGGSVSLERRFRL